MSSPRKYKSMPLSVRNGVRILAIAALAVSTSCVTQNLRPFTTDGCSRFPDGTFSQRDLWKHCCLEHDKAYWLGGSRDERREADHQLGQCVSEVQDAALGFLMSEGVRVGGSPWWPTSYRWGYGWPYGRGYGSISDEEQHLVDDALLTNEKDSSLVDPAARPQEPAFEPGQPDL